MARCIGEFFTTIEPPGRWYRCPWTREIVNAQSIADGTCHQCTRWIEVSESKPLATRRVVVIEYQDPERGWWDRLTEAS